MTPYQYGYMCALEKLSAGMYESLGALIHKGIRPGAAARGEYNLLEHAVGVPQTPFFIPKKRPKGILQAPGLNVGTAVLPAGKRVQPLEHAHTERIRDNEPIYIPYEIR